jgi:Arc/MetJ-type ribon-helix-helix transcriptional regulator
MLILNRFIWKRKKSKRVSVYLTERTLKLIDSLVNKGRYKNRSEFIRRAIEIFLEENQIRP